MKRILSCVYALVGIHLLMILPVLLLILSVPQILEVEIHSTASVSLKVGHSDIAGIKYDRIKSCGSSDGNVNAMVFLPVDFDSRELIVSIDGANENVNIGDISLIKNGIFRQRFAYNKERDHFCLRKEGCVMPWIPHAVRMPLLMFEAFILIFVGMSYWWNKKAKKSEPDRKPVILALLVSLVCAAFLCLVLPLQTYLGNTSSFPFALDTLIGEALIGVIVVGFLVFCGLLLSVGLCGYLFYVLVVAFVVYEYLNTGIMSIGEPPINGDISYYTNQFRRYLDLAMMIGISLGTSLGYRWVRGKLHYICFVLVILMSCSIIDVYTKRKEEATGKKSEGLCSKLDSAQGTVYSRNRNVMVFVLDSFSTEVFKDIMQEDRGLCNAYADFTCFENNIGMHIDTERGVPGYMTGKYFRPELDSRISLNEYAVSCFGPESFIWDYVRCGAHVNFIPGSTLYGFMHPCLINKDSCDDNTRVSAFFSHPEGIPPLSLYEIIRARLTPFAFAMKGRMFILSFAGTNAHSSIKDESALFPLLKAAPISDKESLSLTVFHTYGAHIPYDVDAEGLKTSVPRQDYAGYRDKAHFVLKQVASLLDYFKSSGIYDNSLIVLTTDHAYATNKNGYANDCGLPYNAFALLAVKPFRYSGDNNKQDVAWDKTPTSHCKIKDLVVKSSVSDLTIDEIREILRCEKRLFAHAGKTWMIDGEQHVKMLLPK